LAQLNCLAGAGVEADGELVAVDATAVPAMPRVSDPATTAPTASFFNMWVKPPRDGRFLRPASVIPHRHDRSMNRI
jgi:hypothetical protein